MTPALKIASMSEQEIAALVAEHVMGWRREGNILKGPIGGDPQGAHSYPICNLKTGMGIEAIPKFASSIAAAWQVVEKMRKDGYGLELSNMSENNNLPLWDACFYEMTSYHAEGAIETTAPLAISLAALQAKGVNIP